MALPVWMLVLVAPVIGSWIGVLVRRWPSGRPVALARSQCESCKHPLGAAELVPLASFVALRGRCRHCGAPIGWFHPLIELAAITVAVAAIVADGGGARAWQDAALGWALLCAAWIDAETLRLPDFITLPLILAGLAVTGMARPEALYGHAAAAAAGYCGFRLIDGIYWALRHRHGLGQGDAKLLAAAGAWLGLAALPDVVMAAALAGICLAGFGMAGYGMAAGKARAAQPIAFGPALALAFFLVRLFGQ